MFHGKCHIMHGIGVSSTQRSVTKTNMMRDIMMYVSSIIAFIFRYWWSDEKSQWKGW